MIVVPGKVEVTVEAGVRIVRVTVLLLPDMVWCMVEVIRLVAVMTVGNGRGLDSQSARSNHGGDLLDPVVAVVSADGTGDRLPLSTLLLGLFVYIRPSENGVVEIARGYNNGLRIGAVGARHIALDVDGKSIARAVLVAVLSTYRGIISVVVSVKNLETVCFNGLVNGSLVVVLDDKLIRVGNLALLLGQARVSGVQLKRIEVIIERIRVVISSTEASRGDLLHTDRDRAGRDVSFIVRGPVIIGGIGIFTLSTTLESGFVGDEGATRCSRGCKYRRRRQQARAGKGKRVRERIGDNSRCRHSKSNDSQDKRGLHGVQNRLSDNCCKFEHSAQLWGQVRRALL